jgi:hypothetical protein
VLPIRPFMDAWMLRHPEYAALGYLRPASKVTN